MRGKRHHSWSDLQPCQRMYLRHGGHSASATFDYMETPFWVRAEKDQMDRNQEEEVLLDENKEAEKHEFYMTGALAVSPDNEMLAWAEDTAGGEMFTLHIKNIASGQRLLDTPIEVTSNALAPQSQSVLTAFGLLEYSPERSAGCVHEWLQC